MLEIALDWGSPPPLSCTPQGSSLFCTYFAKNCLEFCESFFERLNFNFFTNAYYLDILRHLCLRLPAFLETLPSRHI